MEFNQDTINEMNFNSSRQPIRDIIPLNGMYGSVEKTPELMHLVNKIYKMNDEDFKTMMKPVIEKEAGEKGLKTSTVAKKLLYRKDMIETEFRYFPEAKIKTSEKNK